MTKRCDTCLHFEQTNTVEGECRRYAPRPLVVAEGLLPEWVWPTTESMDWCGEWAHRPVQQERGAA